MYDGAGDDVFDGLIAFHLKIDDLIFRNHGHETAHGIGGRGDKNRDHFLFRGYGKAAGGVAGDQTEAIASFVGEGDEDDLAERLPF